MMHDVTRPSIKSSEYQQNLEHNETIKGFKKQIFQNTEIEHNKPPINYLTGLMKYCREYCVMALKIIRIRYTKTYVDKLSFACIFESFSFVSSCWNYFM